MTASSAAARLQKTLYLPHMCDTAYALAAAMRHFGLRAEVLPPTDEESLKLGLRMCGGRECLPAFLSLGDILRKCREPSFDAAASAFYFPQTCGPCRFGNYSVLLREVLDRIALTEVDLVLPNSSKGFEGLGSRPRELRKLAWQGLVAVDLLTRLQLEHRPYETEKGRTDEVYRACLAEVSAAIEAGGGRRLLPVMRRAADRFGEIRQDRSRERPVIGIVGEIYVRWNAFSNRGLVAEVERLGGEVMLASMSEFIHFVTHQMAHVGRVAGDTRKRLAAFVLKRYQLHWEHRLLKAVAPRLRRPDETMPDRMARLLAPYYDAALGTEAVLTMGRGIEYALQGCHGVLNVLPFSCMPGVIVGGMATVIRRDLQHIPWLDLPYDAQKETNIRTRLEAFLHQAEEFRRRTGRAPRRGDRPRPGPRTAQAGRSSGC
jgi:predicted nucleotide-binding protein (sugar kinase/HSP70/actin superfamily)